MRVKNFRPRENRDKLIYGDGIVKGIVLLAVSEIPYAEIYCGVSGKLPKENSVNVNLDKSNVIVDVAVTVNYSQSVSDIAFMIQEAVKYNVESMTDYNVTAVNVTVKGVSFNEVVINNKEANSVAETKSDTESTADSVKVQEKD